MPHLRDKKFVTDLELLILQKRCEEMERRCRGIEDFGRKALKVLRSGATTSRVSDVETRLEKLCRKTCAVQAQLADRCSWPFAL